MANTTFDINSLAKYLKPGASDDLNRFLESIPEHVGKSALVATGIAWAFAAAIGLYTMVQTQELAKLRVELNEKEAVKPSVPKIKKSGVKANQIEKLLKGLDEMYPGLDFRVNKNKVTVISAELNAYPQFREAMGHIANIRKGWVASIESLCVGRECAKDKLVAVVTLNTISIE